MNLFIKNLTLWRQISMVQTWTQPIFEHRNAESQSTCRSKWYQRYYKIRQKSNTSAKDLLSDICTVIKLILVMPATNAVSERSFSTLSLVKTYLLATMTQERLNYLMALQAHKDLRRLRSDLLNPKFGSQKWALLWLKNHNFSDT